MKYSEVISKEEHTCPRRAEIGGNMFLHPDHWRSDQSCTYCGSLKPEIFMERLERGDIELGPTDKSYKVYVENAGGAPFKSTYRKCPPDSPREMPEDCEHWVVEENNHTKFYFPHLNEEQQKRFIELHNSGKLKIGYPGYFYRAPFFYGRGNLEKVDATNGS